MKTTEGHGPTWLSGVNVAQRHPQDVVHSAVCCLSGSNSAHPLNNIDMELLKEIIQGFGLHQHQHGNAMWVNFFKIQYQENLGRD